MVSQGLFGLLLELEVERRPNREPAAIDELRAKPILEVADDVIDPVRGQNLRVLPGIDNQHFLPGRFGLVPLDRTGFDHLIEDVALPAFAAPRLTVGS
ncbi:MAG: hypothetical protein R2849_09190 [Thermomicrobiales bacterium]